MQTHLSYSQYGDYVRCGKAYQLKRLRKAPQTPTVWLPAGKAVHTAIEAINRSLFANSKGLPHDRSV